METNQIILIAIFIVGIIALVVFWPFGKAAHSTTTIPSKTGTSNSVNSSTTTAPANTITTTTANVIVQFYTVNVQYIYNGPGNKNGINCSYTSSTQQNYNSQTLNGSQKFVLQFNPSSGQCPLTFYSASVNTPGFTLSSTIPSMPITIPAYSNLALQLNMVTPSTSFYGPLTVTIDER